MGPHHTGGAELVVYIYIYMPDLESENIAQFFFFCKTPAQNVFCDILKVSSVE